MLNMNAQVKRILKSLLRRGGCLIPDKFQIESYFYLEMGKKLDLNNPKTMNEKLQWLKLYNRKEEYRSLVDKVKVKDIVAFHKNSINLDERYESARKF